MSELSCIMYVGMVILLLDIIVLCSLQGVFRDIVDK